MKYWPIFLKHEILLSAFFHYLKKRKYFNHFSMNWSTWPQSTPTEGLWWQIKKILYFQVSELEADWVVWNNAECLKQHYELSWWHPQTVWGARRWFVKSFSVFCGKPCWSEQRSSAGLPAVESSPAITWFSAQHSAHLRVGSTSPTRLATFHVTNSWPSWLRESAAWGETRIWTESSLLCSATL